MPQPFDLPAGPERRTQAAPGLKIETRAAANDQPERRQIVGHAVVFDAWTTIHEGRYWTMKEVVRRGAFKNALAEKQDVRSLFNHDPNFVLGRTRSGTLALEEDEVGLLTRTDPPRTQTIEDLVLAPIERGDVSGMSFAMVIRLADKITRTESADGSLEVIDRGGDRITNRLEGERMVTEREVLDADLYDISPVTYPAYRDTDVALRSAALPEEFRAMIAENEKPHRRSAPVREQFRQYLDGK